MSRSLNWGAQILAGLLPLVSVATLGCSPQEKVTPEELPGPGLFGDGTGGSPDLTVTGAKFELPGGALFGDGQVLEIRLTLSDADYDAIEERGNEEVYVPTQATVSGKRIGALELGEIGVRHKGAWSLHHCWDENDGVRNYEAECAKLSLKLKFNKYQDKMRLDGVKRLNLHASSGDATRLHELMAYDTYRHFGVDAPRTAAAHVFVNGVSQGLYIAVESVDGRYTKAHFPEGGGDGDLYKEIWPAPTLAAEAARSSLATNEDSSDGSGLLQFAAAVAGAQGESLVADLASWTSVEDLLRYVAVDRALKNWDGIMAFYSPTSPHNFYWYHDQAGSGQFHLVPWDMDNTLWDFDPYMAPAQWVTAEAVPDWNQEPSGCAARSVWEADGATTIVPPRCDRLLDLLAEYQWQKFEAIGNELLGSSFTQTRLLERVRHFAQLIAPVVAQDPFLDPEQWRANADAFEETLLAARSDFGIFVEGGLRVEGEPAKVPSGSLFLAGGAGFEELSGLGPEELGIFSYGSALSAFSMAFSPDSGLVGTTDLRFEFSLNQEEGAWAEWVNLGLPTEGVRAVDIRAHSRIVVTLATDRPRTVRVRLNSAVYEDAFAGVWSEFGQDLQVTTEPKAFTLSLSGFAYPDWAKDAWSDGQGWTSSDSEALAQVREHFTGVIFAPAGTFDADGELVAATETGSLRVDALTIQ